MPPATAAVMEALLMQAFERRDAAEAQMRHQAASYSQNMARALLAAGHPPPPWLLPHPAALKSRDLAAEAQMRQQVDDYSQSLARTLVVAGQPPPSWLLPDPAALESGRLAAEAQMRQQVDGYSQSLARSLIVAGQPPPSWLLPPDAGAGALQRRDSAEARMGQQVVPNSHSLLRALLASGHRRPPCLLQPPADDATQGNTVQKLSADLDNPRSADHAHHLLSEINHQVKQKAFETDGAKQGIMNGASSAEVNQHQKCASETVTDSTSMHSSNENPSLANSVEVSLSAVSLLLHSVTSHSVEADFCDVPQPATMLVPEKETIHATESEPLEGPRSSTTQLLQNNSLHSAKPTFLESPDSVAGTLLVNDSIEIAENDSLQVPGSTVSILLEKDKLHSDEANFHGATIMPGVLLSKVPTLTDSLDGPQPMASPLLEKDMLHWVSPSCQGHAATQGNDVRDLLVDLANPKSADHVHHVLPEINDWEKTPEAVDVKRVIMNITSSAEVNQCQKCTCETVINSTGMCTSSEDPSLANSVELPHSALESQLQNDALHSVDADFDEAPNHVTIGSPQKEKTHTAEAEADFCDVPQPATMLVPEKETLHANESEPLEGPRSSTTPLLQNNSLHSAKPTFLESPDSVAGTLHVNDSIEIAENDSLQVPGSMVSVLLEKDKLHSDEANFHGATAMPGVLLNKVPKLTDSLDGPQPMASPLLEKDMLHWVSPNCHGHAVTQGNDVRDLLVDLANPKSADHVHHVLPEINDWEKTPEAVDVKRVIMNITSSAEVNQCQKCTCETVINSTGMCTSSEDPSLANSVELPHSALKSQLQNDALHSVDADFDEAPNHVTIGSLQKEKTHTAEAESLEDPRSIATPLRNIDLLHSVKPNIVEVLDSVVATNPENDSIDTSKNDSLQVPYSMVICDNESSRNLEQQSSGCHVLPAAINESILQACRLDDKISESPDVCAWSNIDISAPDLLLEKKQTLTNSIGEQHFLASPLLEKATLHCVQTDFLEAPYSMSSVMLDTYAGHTSETSSLEGIHFPVSPLQENDLLHTVGHAEEVRKRISLSDRSINICPKILEQKNSGTQMVNSAQRECFSPNSKGNRNSSNQTSPLTQEVQAAVNYSPERSMSNFSDAICCNFPSMHTSLCSGSNLDANVTTFPQHLLSYSLAKNLDTEFVSLAGFSDFQADGEGHGIRQENLRVECPIGGVNTAGADDHSNFDETMKKCQSFSIPIPSNSPTINDMAFQGFCESKKLISLSSSLSAKYKMKHLDGKSLLSKFEKIMSQSLSCSIKTSLLDTSYDSKKLGDLGKCSLDFGGAFMTPTCGSSNSYGVQEDSDVPLTLSAEKYDLEKLSRKTGSGSDYLGFMPELPCFRIDEESTNLEENENQVKLCGCITRNYSRQGLVAKKPPGHATNKYQRNGTNNQDLTAGKSYRRKPDWHAHIRVNQGIKIPKENRALSIRKVEQVAHPLLDRLCKKEMSSSKSERSRGTTNLEKGCRPRNLVSSMTSFIPLDKQKKQYLTSCVKRDVRVRALEAAEAVKHQDEKKQAEREKRKAAVELERKRLKQENEHKQKQVEQQKKKDAYIITRKRQRENDRKRGNDRKKKCVVEAPKHQKKLVEIMHSTNAVKDACPKDTDGKGLVENLARGMKHQLLSDEKMESVRRLIASESNNPLAMCSDSKSEDSGLQFQESLSGDVDKSYEMSPYEDSDEEHYDNLEHEREIRRKHKLIPSWAQKENLDKILLSNQALVPREVFAHKRSFILSDGIPYRQFHY